MCDGNRVYPLMALEIAVVSIVEIDNELASILILNKYNEVAEGTVWKQGTICKSGSQMINSFLNS